MRTTCKKCGKMLVLPGGPVKSKYLLVGEFPVWEEVRQGVPFIGKKGEVLENELRRAGLQMRDCRMTNLWQHDRDEADCDPTWHLNQLVKEFKGRTHVLLMGSELISALLGSHVMDYSGCRVTVPEFKSIHFWVSPNPAIVFKSTVGELRLSITRFVQDIRK
jgi:uracil-DNA glycosylase family 4